LSLSIHLWVWLDPGVMREDEEATSTMSAMTLWSALVVMAIVWAAEAPLETKAWDPIGWTA